MSKEYLLILILSHILADFYFQTNKIAKGKKKKAKWLFLHCMLYMLLMFLMTLCFFSEFYPVIGGIVAGVVHFVIDSIKYCFTKYYPREKHKISIQEKNVFFADQMIHILSITCIVLWINNISKTPVFQGTLYQFFKNQGGDMYHVILWITVLLLIHKPANIAISLLMKQYKVDNVNNEASPNDRNAGRFIGVIERILMVVMLSDGQYAAIGLVLTAKSIARYDKISKEPAFAEYYLLGTLLSTLIAVLASFFVR